MTTSCIISVVIVLVVVIATVKSLLSGPFEPSESNGDLSRLLLDCTTPLKHLYQRVQVLSLCPPCAGCSTPWVYL